MLVRGLSLMEYSVFGLECVKHKIFNNYILSIKHFQVNDLESTRESTDSSCTSDQRPQPRSSCTPALATAAKFFCNSSPTAIRLWNKLPLLRSSLLPPTLSSSQLNGGVGESPKTHLASAFTLPLPSVPSPHNHSCF